MTSPPKNDKSKSSSARPSSVSKDAIMSFFTHDQMAPGEVEKWHGVQAGSTLGTFSPTVGVDEMSNRALNRRIPVTIAFEKMHKMFNPFKEDESDSEPEPEPEFDYI